MNKEKTIEIAGKTLNEKLGHLKVTEGEQTINYCRPICGGLTVEQAATILANAILEDCGDSVVSRKNYVHEALEKDTTRAQLPNGLWYAVSTSEWEGEEYLVISADVGEK